MIRVLQCVNNMHRAGLESVLMNYYRNIDRTRIQFDFLTHRPWRDDFDDEIEAMGGRIYRAPRLYPQNYPAYFSYMKRLFAEHPEYRIVHSHIDAMSYLPLLAAKKAGVPIRIAHSHNTSIDRDLKYPMKQYFRYRLPAAANRYCACGREAGQFLFRGSGFQWIPNAVQPQQYCYDPQLRAQKRQELMLGDSLTVGHVGRLSYQKNHEFLIDVFAEFLRQRPDAVLLLTGKGEKEQSLRRKVHTMGLDGAVRFLGSRSDVNGLYQAMDLFVMPSHFEGVPMAGIEAQLAGLPCVFSDNVPKEVCFTADCRFLSLDQSVYRWVYAMQEMTAMDRKAPDLSNCPYHIDTAKQVLTEYYLEQLAGLAGEKE